MGRRRRGAWDDAPSRTPPTRSPSRARTPTGDSPRQRGPPEAVSFQTPRSPLTTQSPQPPAWYSSRPQASRRRHPHRRATTSSSARSSSRRSVVVREEEEGAIGATRRFRHCEREPDGYRVARELVSDAEATRQALEQRRERARTHLRAVINEEVLGRGHLSSPGDGEQRGIEGVVGLREPRCLVGASEECFHACRRHVLVVMVRDDDREGGRLAGGWPSLPAARMRARRRRFARDGGRVCARVQGPRGGEAARRVCHAPCTRWSARSFCQSIILIHGGRWKLTPPPPASPSRPAAWIASAAAAAARPRRPPPPPDSRSGALRVPSAPSSPSVPTRPSSQHGQAYVSARRGHLSGSWCAEER